MKKQLLRTTLSVLAISLCTQALAGTDDTSTWSYAGATGPQHWGSLSKEYSLCSSGQAQSPIDIGEAVEVDRPRLTFAYPLSDARVLNKGHTLQVAPVDASALPITADEYALVQMHFHSPSEERIQGRTYPLGAHFVTRNASGALAVVALQFVEGAHNPALESVLADMPKKAGGETRAPVQSIIALLPDNRRHYAYMGSLTTPPCSEGVLWQVLSQPVELSRAQLQALQKIFPMNARPVQPLNGRRVQVGG